MELKQKKQYIIGGVTWILSLVLVIFIFIFLSEPKEMANDLYDTVYDNKGWSYDLLIDGNCVSTVVEYDDGMISGFLSEQPKAARIKRKMTEKYEEIVFLEFDIDHAGIEVFIDDIMLYSDFCTDKRNDYGFLVLEGNDTKGMNTMERRNVRFSLPCDYTDKILTVVTYFTDDTSDYIPIYPVMYSENSYNGPFATETVKPVFVMTVCAILALFLCAVFIADISNGKADYRMLLLILFFLFMFTERAQSSLVGYYSGFSNKFSLAFLSGIYALPLYYYIALYLTKWRKYLLLIGSTSLLTYTIIRTVYEHSADWYYISSNIGEAILFLILIVMFAMECIVGRKEIREVFKPLNVFITAVSLTISITYYCIFFEANLFEFIEVVVANMKAFNFIMAPFSMTLALMAVTFLIIEFIRRTLRTRRMVSILEEKSHQTMENYKMLLKSEEKTKALRHEIRHHMTALMGIIKNNDTERAVGYISSIENELWQISDVLYSRNILVNAIAAVYLERAKKNGVKIDCRLSVPEQLDIADEDLCVMFTNMLENAVEACERLDNDMSRYIKVRMNKDGNYLFIGCKNSTKSLKSDSYTNDFPTEKENRKLHGCGITAMKKIAEKYHGILKIDILSGEFSVKTTLLLK